MENEDLISFKKNLRNEILRIYKQDGYDIAMNSTLNLIKKSNKKANEIGKKELPVQIRGECTELLLELQIREYARKRNLPWILSKGLTIPRLDNKKGMTELDLTLFTPAKIILFESKYRQGKYNIFGECQLVPQSSYGFPTNVYLQNLLHLDNLRKHLSSAIITVKLSKPFSICLYMSDLSKVEDKREVKYKSLIPLLGPNNINNYLKDIENNKIEVWNIGELQKKLIELDSKNEENFKKHLENMKKRRN